MNVILPGICLTISFNEMNVLNQKFTYQDIMDSVCVGKDDYGIAALCTERYKQTFFSNPNLTDYSKVFLYISKVDDTIGGIGMTFPTQFKADSELVDSLGGTTLEVHESFRHLALGADIVFEPLQDKSNKVIIYAGLADIALAFYKKLKFVVFEYPRLMQLRNVRCILESKGLKGGLLSVTTKILNGFIKPFNCVCNYKSRNFAQKYIVKKLMIVPDWVDEIVFNDGHKYMEVHDRKWLQWNVDYNLFDRDGDIQSFFGIYQSEKPIGFFMTKERFRKTAGGVLNNIVIGSIVEWGSIDEIKLSEYDIYKIAISTFSKNVDIVELATTDHGVVRRMRKFGFIQHGYAHIVFKDLTNKYKDSADPNLWRIRFGYADLIIT